MTRIAPMRSPVQKGQRNTKAPALRKAARNMHCKLHIPGICRQDPAYTVGCHVRLFGVTGAGQKPDDLFIIDACDKCHAVFDSRDKWAQFGLDWKDILRGLMQTQKTRLDAGLITLKGD